MAEISKAGVPNKYTEGSVGDIYTNTLTDDKYTLAYIYRTTTYDGVTVEYEWIRIYDDNETSSGEGTTIISNVNSNMYIIDNNEWDIDNTGNIETSLNIQRSIDYAHQNGFRDVLLTEGSYLLSCENVLTDILTGGVSLPDGITLHLDKDAILIAKPNGLLNYALILIQSSHGGGVIGGTLIGDRDSHDFSANGTHESCHLINIRISENIRIDNVKLKDATGDCICIGGGYRYGEDGYLRPNNISVRNCILDGARRNNLSVIDGQFLDISDNIIINAGAVNGTLPKYGIDLESNRRAEMEWQEIYDVTITNNKFRNNEQGSVINYNGFRVNISDNICDNVINAGYGRNTVISNNIIKVDDVDSGKQGIVVQYMSDLDNQALIMGNQLTNCSASLSGNNIEFMNNKINNGGVGITRISNCYMSGNSIIATSSGHGFVLNASKANKNITIANNNIIGVNTQNCYGIYSRNGGYDITKLYIVNNNIQDFMIGICTQAHLGEILIKSNIIKRVSSEGISSFAITSSGDQNISISHNNIENQKRGVDITGTDNSLVCNFNHNVLTTNGTNQACLITDSSANQQVQFNVCYNTFGMLNAASGYVFALIKNSKNLLFANNIFTNNIPICINTSNATSTNIVNNIFNGRVTTDESDINTNNINLSE